MPKGCSSFGASLIAYDQLLTAAKLGKTSARVLTPLPPHHNINRSLLPCSHSRLEAIYDLETGGMARQAR